LINNFTSKSLSVISSPFEFLALSFPDAASSANSVIALLTGSISSANFVYLFCCKFPQVKLPEVCSTMFCPEPLKPLLLEVGSWRLLPPNKLLNIPI
jgi:hypothetical protein